MQVIDKFKTFSTMKKIVISGASVLALGGVVTAITVPIVLSGKDNGKLETNVITYNVNQKVDINKFSIQTKSEETVQVFDPKINKDAIAKIDELYDSLTIEKLKTDFIENTKTAGSGILTDFYEVVEYENESTTTETEIEIDSITPISKNGNTFILNVKYSIETENDKTDDEKEEIKSLEIEWSPELTVLDNTDITKIKSDILALTNKPTTGGNAEVDFEDLREIFLGEKDDDDMDDVGIFDLLAKRQDVNSGAQLIGYKVTLSDVFTKILEANKLDTSNIEHASTNFTIPSAALGFVVIQPDIEPTINYSPKPVIDMYDINDVNTLFANPITDAALIKTTLTNILEVAPTQAQLDTIQSIQIVNVDANFVQVGVTFKPVNSKPSVIQVFAISVSNFKSPVTPVF